MGGHHSGTPVALSTCIMKPVARRHRGELFSLLVFRANFLDRSCNCEIRNPGVFGKPVGLHYTDGPMVDMWQWKPSRGGMLGRVDNMYMAPPRDQTPDEASQLIRYQGGYWGDPGRASYVYNFLPLRPNEYHPGSPVAIRRLPKDYQAMTKAMGHWDPNPDASVDDGSQWWMLEDESVPYSAEADAKIPVGTIIPGVLIIGDYEGPRAAVT